MIVGKASTSAFELRCSPELEEGVEDVVGLEVEDVDGLEPEALAAVEAALPAAAAAAEELRPEAAAAAAAACMDHLCHEQDEPATS